MDKNLLLIYIRVRALELLYNRQQKLKKKKLWIRWLIPVPGTGLRSSLGYKPAPYSYSILGFVEIFVEKLAYLSSEETKIMKYFSSWPDVWLLALTHMENWFRSTMKAIKDFYFLPILGKTLKLIQIFLPDTMEPYFQVKYHLYFLGYKPSPYLNPY